MGNSIRKALGFTDDQVITILIALKDDIRWMKKNRPQLMEDIIEYLGITDEELATARHKRNITKHMAEEHASLVVSGRIRPIAVLIDSAKRSGPSEQEQRKAMETIKKRISKELKHHYYTVIREMRGEAGIIYEAYVLTDQEYEQEPVQLDLREKGLIIKKAIPEDWEYKAYLIGTFSHGTMDQLEAAVDAFAARAVE